MTSNRFHNKNVYTGVYKCNGRLKFCADNHFGMGELLHIIEDCFKYDSGLAMQLANAEVIEIHYTSRLKKNRDEWVIQLRSKRGIEALVHTKPQPELNRALLILAIEARDIKIYFERTFGKAPRIETYYCAEGKQKRFEYEKLA